MIRILAFAAALLLVGCTSRVAEEPRLVQIEGTAAASGSPFRAPHVLDVPPGTLGLNATLTWNGTGAALGMELFSPSGTRAVVAARTNGGQLGLAHFEPPAAGRWTLYVVGDVTATTRYALRVLMPEDHPVNNTLSRAAQVRSGAFLELDVRMAEGATLAYAIEASAPVRWDLHSHDAAGVRTWAAGNGTHASADLVAPVEGVYSLYATPLTETARIRLDLMGQFESYG